MKGYKVEAFILMHSLWKEYLEIAKVNQEINSDITTDTQFLKINDLEDFICQEVRHLKSKFPILENSFLRLILSKLRDKELTK